MRGPVFDGLRYRRGGQRGGTGAGRELRYKGATLSSSPPRFADLFSRRPVILAPMEDVTDAVFRALCRTLGADLCVTEFVNVEGLLRGCRNAARKIDLADDDTPTAIQIYGADPERLAEAARVAEEARARLHRHQLRLLGARRSRAAAPARAGCAIPTAMVAMAKHGRRRACRSRSRSRRASAGARVAHADRRSRAPARGRRRRRAHHPLPHRGDGSLAAPPTGAGRAARARSVSIPVIVNGDVRAPPTPRRRSRRPAAPA